tara:strand:- start:19 stop:315 length:297 start_codon:yes stop_codon:yes gene_type:complete
MKYDHKAVARAYAGNWSRIADDEGCYDKDGNKFEPDATLVAAARAEIDKEAKNQEYFWKRQKAYPPWQDQLAYIYDNGIDKWKTDMVDPVKTKYPKPE